MRVLVIGTVHEDVGRANSAELLTILVQIQPEVIFLEMPPSAIADYFGGPRSNLESTAVSRYREHHQVDLVPVDLPTPSAEFFSNIEEVRRSIRSRSVDYRRLVSWDEQYVEDHGFEYLNSAEYNALRDKMHAASLAALTKIGDPRPLEIYEVFTSTNERRDEAMLGNIESYCVRTSFHSGVLLVGAAHRQSLSLKSVAHAGPNPRSTQWDFFGTM